MSQFMVFCSLFGGFSWKKRFKPCFDRDIELIREETTLTFWTKEEIEHAYMRENLHNFEKIGKMFERLSTNDFFERLSHSIESKFSLFDQMLTLEAEAVKRGAEHIKEGMDALARSQEKQRDLGLIHENILTQLKQFNDNTISLHVKMNKEQVGMLEGQQRAS